MNHLLDQRCIACGLPLVLEWVCESTPAGERHANCKHFMESFCAQPRDFEWLNPQEGGDTT